MNKTDTICLALIGIILALLLALPIILLKTNPEPIYEGITIPIVEVEVIGGDN